MKFYCLLMSTYRVTIDPPQFDVETRTKIKAAVKDRTVCDFDSAETAFVGLLENGDLGDFERVWLQAQLFKTRSQMGHYQSTLSELSKVLADLEQKHDFITSETVDQNMEFMYYKLSYRKAKLQIKLRLLADADRTIE